MGINNSISALSGYSKSLNFDRLRQRNFKHKMISKKIAYSIILSLLSTQMVFAQLYYKRSDSIKVKENNNFFDYPFQGGYNAPQFNEIDLNLDNTMDLVVFDRSGGRISTYINLGIAGQVSYVYSPSYERAFPDVSDWLFCRDYNCDGKLDLITGVRGSSVRVYENVSNSTIGLQFNYVGVIQSLYYGSSISLNINPGGSNLPAIGDMNNDGDIDFIFFDQRGAQMEYHRNVSVENNGTCGLLFEQRSECWGDFTESGLSSTIYLNYCRFGNTIPNAESNNGGSVRNLGSKAEATDKRSSKHAGSSVSMIELGTDSNKDLIVGDVGGNFLTALYNNDSIAPFINSNIFQKDTTFPSYDIPVDLPVFPAPYFLDVNNDQKKDMIVSTNSNDYLARSRYSKNVLYYENTGTTENLFQYRQNDFLQEEVIDLGRGAYPCFVDYNNDGLADLIVGNDGYLDTSQNLIVGQLALFENIGTASQAEYDLVDRDYGGLSGIPLDLTTNGPQRFLVPAAGDLDGDGDDDLIIGDDDGRVHFFKDVSATGSNATYVLQNAAFQGINVYNRAAPALVDVDQDNLLDLVIGSNLGNLEYHKNTGSATQPIFNLEVQSITWQNSNILRYQLRGNPDLSSFQIGQVLDVNDALNGDNNALQTISAINNSQNYLDLIHPTTNSNIDDEVNSTAVIDYSIKNWGNVRLAQYFNGDGNSTPFLYRNVQNELQMIIGSRNGYLYFFNQIDSNINSGSFNLVDSIYTSNKYGANSAVSAADLNQDSYIDLAVGNEAGGFAILEGSATTSLDDLFVGRKDNEEKLRIYPNPAGRQVNIQVPENLKGNYTLRIYDLSGKIVLERSGLSSRNYTLNQELKAALYVVEVAGSEKTFTAKLLIKP